MLDLRTVSRFSGPAMDCVEASKQIAFAKRIVDQEFLAAHAIHSDRDGSANCINSNLPACQVLRLC
jgi:hypothetical protein